MSKQGSADAAQARDLRALGRDAERMEYRPMLTPIIGLPGSGEQSAHLGTSIRTPVGLKSRGLSVATVSR